MGSTPTESDLKSVLETALLDPCPPELARERAAALDLLAAIEADISRLDSAIEAAEQAVSVTLALRAAGQWVNPDDEHDWHLRRLRLYASGHRYRGQPSTIRTAPNR